MQEVMDNLQLILEQAGTSFDFSLRDRAVMARVFITDMRYFDIVNEIYASYFRDGCLPCRTTIGVVGLASLGDVEIDLIVYCGD